MLKKNISNNALSKEELEETEINLLLSVYTDQLDYAINTMCISITQNQVKIKQAVDIFKKQLHHILQGVESTLYVTGNYGQTHYLLAELYAGTDQKEKAIESFNIASYRCTDNEMLIYFAFVCARLNKDKEQYMQLSSCLINNNSYYTNEIINILDHNSFILGHFVAGDLNPI